MSHFFTLVLIPRDTKNVEEAVERLLAPYDENLPNNTSPKWDWWRIGGRWNGRVMGRPRDSEDGYNFGPEYSRLEENMAPVTALPEDLVPFAIVTPDGKWRGRGEMRWFGIAVNMKPSDEWISEVKRILEAHQDCIAVGCDLHI